MGSQAISFRSAGMPWSGAGTLHSTNRRADTRDRNLFLSQGRQSTLVRDTGLNPTGPGYELVVTTDGVMHIEPFQNLPAVLSRERRAPAGVAAGWRETGAPNDGSRAAQIRRRLVRSSSVEGSRPHVHSRATSRNARSLSRSSAAAGDGPPTARSPERATEPKPEFPLDGFPNHDSVAEADIVRSKTLVHVVD